MVEKIKQAFLNELIFRYDEVYAREKEKVSRFCNLQVILIEFFILSLSSILSFIIALHHVSEKLIALFVAILGTLIFIILTNLMIISDYWKKGKKKLCIFCKEIIPLESTKCPFCQKAFCTEESFELQKRQYENFSKIFLISFLILDLVLIITFINTVIYLLRSS